MKKTIDSLINESRMRALNPSWLRLDKNTYIILNTEFREYMKKQNLPIEDHGLVAPESQGITMYRGLIITIEHVSSNDKIYIEIE